MNLRISENNFRFRVTPEDLDILLRGEGLAHKFSIGGKDFEYAISPAVPGVMRLEIETGKINLSVPQQALEDLRELGRSKEGLFVAQGNTGISLQLDIKAQKRNAPDQRRPDSHSS